MDETIASLQYSRFIFTYFLCWQMIAILRCKKSLVTEFFPLLLLRWTESVHFGEELQLNLNTVKTSADSVAGENGSNLVTRAIQNDIHVHCYEIRAPRKLAFPFLDFYVK